jgi:xanthine dehydrogenase accessory factor
MTNQAGGTESSLIADAIASSLNRGASGALATVIDGPMTVGAKLFVESKGRVTGTLGSEELDAVVENFARGFVQSRDDAKTYKVEDFAAGLTELRGVRILFERIEPEPRLVICGAGHVGTALARLAKLIGYSTTLIDDRADFLTRDRFPDTTIELILAEDWAASVRQAIGIGRGVSVAVVTRGHNEDEQCLRAVVASRPDYVGLIGSKRRTNIVISRLRDSGADSDVLSGIRAPIGLDIGAVSPEEVALSILAEVVAVRRGGAGGSMSEWRRANSD